MDAEAASEYDPPLPPSWLGIKKNLEVLALRISYMYKWYRIYRQLQTNNVTKAGSQKLGQQTNGVCPTKVQKTVLAFVFFKSLVTM